MDIATPEDHDEFRFLVGTGSNFSLRRDPFYEATLMPGEGRLLVAYVEDAAELDERVTATLELTGPAVGGAAAG
jgi:hypothetical protein